MASRKGEFGEPVVLDVEGFDVRVSSPQRVYFAARGETKLDLVNYYLSVGDGIVRALRERPCMLHRFPDGVSGPKVHQKRLPRGAPPWVETVRLHFPRYGLHADELCVTRLADVAWDESTVGILSVLVFGAGTDYALLLISRYRDQLRVTEDRREAMAIALRRTTEAIVASSSTVVIGLLTLLLSLFPATRGLGLACAVGVVVAAFFVLVVLPAALVVFGRWIFWPKVPKVGQAGLADANSLWRRIGDAVAKRPAGFVTVTLLALAVMAGGITQIKTGLDGPDQFLQKPEAIAAAERLGESFPAGAADPVSYTHLTLPTSDLV